MKRRLIAASALVLLTACGQPRSDAQAPARPAAAPMIDSNGAAPAGSLDDFVAKAAASDIYEVEAGKIAEAKGQTAGVRDFGKMMQADHTKSTADLKDALAAAGSSVAPPPALPGDKQAMLDALNAAAPGKFDDVYLNQQQAAHRAALDLMKSYADHGAVAQVKAFASQTAAVVQAHLDKVKSLRSATE